MQNHSNVIVENLEKAIVIIFDKKVSLVEKKSDYQKPKNKESTTSDQAEKSSDKSDDPIRMYLREMGGVELLSREGEIAIAKRIEAGKDLMINALTQSPIVGKKMFEWKEKLEKGELLIRDIIDIDSTYEDFESEDQNSSKQKKLKEKSEGEPDKKNPDSTKENTENQYVFKNKSMRHG